MLTIERIKNNGWLIFEAIVGSRAYGLNTETSDTDIRGVYVLPKELFYSLDYYPQVSNESNDIVYYELRRFIELLAKNNPNILEMLNLPNECIFTKHEIMNRVKPELFLSKLCEQTFANYAFTQIKKAYGLEKKIVNPVEKERKSLLDFCFVYLGKEVLALNNFLAKNEYEQAEMGLSSITHLRDSYNLFRSTVHKYKGIVRSTEANDVCVSNIPIEETPIGLLYFNKDGYSQYCKHYREYWEWVSRRNDNRYNSTMAHGKKYDAKNMMHVFRLLNMAGEIAKEGKVNVLRTDRPFLLSIKEGKFEYDDLVQKAEVVKNELPAMYQNSKLKEEPDIDEINKLLNKMRSDYYNE
jgi:predicted nucleotidyltransferase